MKNIIAKVVKTSLIVSALMLSLGLATSFAQPALAFDPETGIQGGADSAQGAGQSSELFGDEGIFSTITNILLFLIGAISVIMLIIGGFRYVLSGGDQSAVTSAKNTILYAVIGIIVAILAYAIVNFVVSGLAP